MDEPLLLNEVYLKDLVKKVYDEKSRYNKALNIYKKSGNKWFKTESGWTNEWEGFITKYAITMHNIMNKVRAFEKYFTELNVKFPKFPEIDLCIHMEIADYPDTTLVEELFYKDETIEFEYDFVYNFNHAFEKYRTDPIRIKNAMDKLKEQPCLMLIKM